MAFDPDIVIYETQNFVLLKAPRPFVSREEGGHIMIHPKRDIPERRDLNPVEAVEFIWFSSIVGEALELAMNERGVKVIKINYQDMGNWAYRTGNKFRFHEHIFGRAVDAKRQVFPYAVEMPERAGKGDFYEGFEALNEDDVAKIRDKIEEIKKRPKYTDKNKWKLN